MYTIVIIKGSFTQVQRLCFHAPGSCRYHGPPAAYLKNQITSWQMQELYRFSDPSRHLHPFRDRAIALDTNGLNSGLCSCPCTGKNSLSAGKISHPIPLLIFIACRWPLHITFVSPGHTKAPLCLCELALRSGSHLFMSAFFYFLQFLTCALCSIFIILLGMAANENEHKKSLIYQCIDMSIFIGFNAFLLHACFCVLLNAHNSKGDQDLNVWFIN